MSAERGNPAVVPEIFDERLRDTFPGALGIELISLELEEVRARMEVDKRHLHPGGFVHGGAWVAYADTVAAWGTMRNLDPGLDFSTVQLGTNVFLAATAGDVLDACGKPVHIGRRTQVWEVLITREGRNAALFTCTQMVLEGR